MRKPTILLVDDLEKNLLALEVILKDFDIRILKATSGAEALKISVREDLALILLDVQMPEMDGFQTAEFLRAQKATQHLPIIFVTAISQEQKHVFKGYESGAVDYLFKPLDSIVLKSKVKVFVELYQQKLMLEEQSQELADNLAIQNDLNAQLVQKSLELEQKNESMRQDLRVAKDFQQTIINYTSQFLFLNIAERWLPLSEVSGDIYHVSTSSKGDSNIFFGDVMGHGITAGFVTMMTKIVLNHIPDDLPPNEIMSQMSSWLASQEMEKFVTAVYCRITPAGLLTLSNAGHPPLILIPSDGTDIQSFDKESAMPLGIFMKEPMPYPVKKYQLKPGDQLLIYSDGITDWRNENNDVFGKEGLGASLQKHRFLELDTILTNILDDVEAFAQYPCEDDVTLLLIQYTG